jgi:hypothetical protein
VDCWGWPVIALVAACATIYLAAGVSFQARRGRWSHFLTHPQFVLYENLE